MQSENNKRIAKNTMMLYFRMIFTSVVALFTTRIVLQILGVVDFGVFNVVGGVVGLFGMLNGSLISASQRFLTYELGKENLNKFNQIFNMLILIFVVFGLIIITISFLSANIIISEFLNIPSERLHAASIVFYFSVLMFVCNLITIPFISSVIAHEKMEAYAYLSIIEVTLKLLVVYLLYKSNYDKLITYSILLTGVMLLVLLFYVIYSNKNLPGCKYIFYWNKSLFYELTTYTSWNMFGSITGILNVQGLSILLNLFFGPVVNAAKGISDKIYTIVASFSNNFYMAVRPQIIKNYANGEKEIMFDLVINSTKYSFYLLLLISLPLIFYMDQILEIWLGHEQITYDMVMFSKLTLAYSLINVFELPLSTMVQATGNIKKYQIVIGSFTLLFLPISYFFFQGNGEAYTALIILIIIYAIALIIRLMLVKQQLGFPVEKYLKRNILRLSVVFIPIVGGGLFIKKIISGSIYHVLGGGILLVVFSFLVIYIIGLSNNERGLIKGFIARKFKR